MNRHLGDEHLIPESWIVVDGQKVDVREFLLVHPGGPAVLMANLGRDASADFHHVSAHACPAVTRRLHALGIGSVDTLGVSAWSGLLDYLLLIRNASAVQDNSRRPGNLQHIYIAQTLAHLAGDHLQSFCNRLCGMAGRPVKALPGSFQDLILGASAELANASGRPAAAELVEDLQDAAANLLQTLVVLARRGVVEGGKPEAGRLLADRALAEIDSWLIRLPRPELSHPGGSL